MTLSPETILTLVDDHAIQKYEEGWDQWIECMDKEEKLEILKGCTTEKAAILKAAKTVKLQCQYNEIRAENCALYDTGEDSKTEFYNQITENAAKSEEDLAS